MVVWFLIMIGWKKRFEGYIDLLERVFFLIFFFIKDDCGLEKILKGFELFVLWFCFYLFGMSDYLNINKLYIFKLSLNSY